MSKFSWLSALRLSVRLFDNGYCAIIHIDDQLLLALWTEKREVEKCGVLPQHGTGFAMANRAEEPLSICGLYHWIFSFRRKFHSVFSSSVD